MNNEYCEQTNKCTFRYFLAIKFNHALYFRYLYSVKNGLIATASESLQYQKRFRVSVDFIPAGVISHNISLQFI